MMGRFFFILILLLSCSSIWAQKQELVYDTATIDVRQIPQASIDTYKKDPAFQYDVVHAAPKSLWDRFWQRFWEKISSLFETEGGIRATKIILVTIAVIILIVFFMIFSGMGKGGLFGKKNQGDPLDYAVSEDDIHAISFDAAIEEAISNGNFRFAVRLLYLQTLKNLTDAGIINWQLNKTNIAYLQELKDKPYQDNFKKLTLQFENNWYGDLPIDANEFQAVRSQFNKFNQELL